MRAPFEAWRRWWSEPQRHERALVVALVDLIGPQGDYVLGDWDAGEPGLALEGIGDSLADRYLPVPAHLRRHLLDLADAYGVAPRVHQCLRFCPDPDDDPPWTVVEDTDRAVDLLLELDAEIGPGHVLSGADLTPWLACRRCDDVLVRLDDRAAHAGRAPYRCAVVHPTWTGRTEPTPWPSTAVHTDVDAALDDLLHHDLE